MRKNPNLKSEKARNFLDYFIITLIILNVLAIILESFESLYMQYENLFNGFEVFSVAVFSIEYIMRILALLKHSNSGKPIKTIFLFIISPLSIIDLLAIVPFYLSLIPGVVLVDLRILRILRLTRLLRILKLMRYSKASTLIIKVLKDKKDELSVSLFITLMLLVVASTLMYYIEHSAQPDKFPNILASFWWAIATLTTVGYGDIYPITEFGRFISGIIAVLGIGLVALPTGIISSSFIEAVNSKNSEASEKINYCPHCGKKLTDN